MLQEPSSWAWVTEVTAGDQALGRGCTLPRGARHPVHLQVGGQQSWRIGEAGPLVPTPPRERAPARLPSAWNVHCAGSLATRLSHPCRPRPTARGPHSWARSLHRPPAYPAARSPPRLCAQHLGARGHWHRRVGGRGALLPATCFLPAPPAPPRPQPQVPSALPSRFSPT